MSLRTPSKDRRRPRLLCRGARESYHRAEAACGWSLPVCLMVKPVGEPDAGDRHVRFDERGWETERCRMAQATAPILDSTICDLWRHLIEGCLRRLSGRVATAARGPGLTLNGPRDARLERRHRPHRSRTLPVAIRSVIVGQTRR